MQLIRPAKAGMLASKAMRQIVVLLRQAGYGFAAIRPVLSEVAMGQVEQAARAAERRLQDLLAESKRCCAATAAAWSYFQEANKETRKRV